MNFLLKVGLMSTLAIAIITMLISTPLILHSPIWVKDNTLLNLIGGEQRPELTCTYEPMSSTNLTYILFFGAGELLVATKKLNKVLQTVREDVLRSFQTICNQKQKRHHGFVNKSTKVTVIRVDTEFLDGQYLNWSDVHIKDIGSISLRYQAVRGYNLAVNESEQLAINFYPPSIDNASCTLYKKQRHIHHCVNQSNISITTTPEVNHRGMMTRKYHGTHSTKPKRLSRKVLS